MGCLPRPEGASGERRVHSDGQAEIQITFFLLDKIFYPQARLETTPLSLETRVGSMLRQPSPPGLGLKLNKVGRAEA